MISEREIFDKLQQKFSLQCKSTEMRESRQTTKDVIMKNLRNKYDQIRASYRFNDKTNTYEMQPFEIIKKERIDDINIKKGIDNYLFKSDFRITANLEH